MDHKNIVKFIECDEDDNNIYLRLELCKREDLNEIIKKGEKIDIKNVILQIIEGVDYLHKKGILHRDLKCSNILFDKDNNVKICDFGLSTYTESSIDIVETPAYVSPEIINGSYPSEASDIWCIGIIIYTILVGDTPFKSNSMKESYAKIKNVNYTYPEDSNVPFLAKDLINLILNQKPENRPSLETIKSHEFFK